VAEFDTRPVTDALQAWGERGVALMPPVVRQFIRSREIGLTVLAGLIGVASAGFVAFMNLASNEAHALLFDLHPGERLSAVAKFDEPLVLWWPVGGGVVLAAMTWFGARIGRTNVVDPIEANALHGGRMSFRDSALLALQTLVSNGSGASVGLEAGYTQIASGFASRVGSWTRLRRDDMRILVACGAAGAIAAAFNGPLTGAFYAFELVLAQYAIGYVAPILAASIVATLSMHLLGGASFTLAISPQRAVTVWDYPWFMLLGVLCAGIGIFWMRAVPLVERLLTVTRAPRIMHPILGGLLLGAIAFVSPQVLSGGHGALSLSLLSDLTLGVVLTLAALKILASALSLGAGFRGGLFFASLLAGALIGRGLGLALGEYLPQTGQDTTALALVGMGALAAVVIGTPLTMSFLVLETTSDYGLTGAVLAASVTANLIAREFFGYSFSTWRFHLRGETIRSAHDIGWVRDLTVGRLMRADPAKAPPDMRVHDFQEAFPLGMRRRVALVDREGRYFGIVSVPEAHAEGVDPAAPVATLAHGVNAVLLPAMSVKDAMRLFDAAESDTLGVVASAETRLFLGTLQESYATRRYVV
jgi:CIC family chloride channel protein